MILRREIEPGAIVVDTKNVTMISRERVIYIHISGLSTPTYKQYEEADLCPINEVESEIIYLVGIMFPSLIEKDVEVNLSEGKGSYSGAEVILT